MNKVRTKKTDHSHFLEKLNLRLASLPSKKEVRVLDCFAGKGKLWRQIKDNTSKSIRVLSIDKKANKKTALRGDNIKYMGGMDLNKFDIIDLDAYGIPFKQLALLFKKKYKGVIIVTFIQALYGQLPYEMLEEIGYTKTMVKRCPTLFFRNGLQKFEEYLAKNKVRKVRLITKRKKAYLSFKVS